MNIQKIIITGGSGFLGHHMYRKLTEMGLQVINIDKRVHPTIPTTVADILNPLEMMEHVKDADAVLHFAALIEAGESVKFPQKFIDSNISGTLKVLEAMKHNGIKNIVFSSTAAVYGEPLNIPIKEDDRTLPINPYGMTKLAMEALISSYVASNGLSACALRYFNLYGPEEHHEPETHAIPRFISQVYHDEEVTVWGTGEHKRDYIHVRDVVDAHIQALALCERIPGKYHYFNISTEQPKSVLEIVALLEKELGKKANVKHFEGRPGDPLLLYASAEKAKEQLGWQAKVSIEEGLKETVEHFKSQFEK